MGDHDEINEWLEGIGGETPQPDKPARTGETVTEARSFHSRLRVTPQQAAVLSAACSVFGDVTRAVYCAIKSGSADPRTELTATLGVQRWYIDSAMRRVNGLLQSAKSNRERIAALYDTKAEAADKKAEREAARLEGSRTPKKRQERKTAIHYAKRRASIMRVRAEKMRTGEPTICFGSRALFRQQPAIIEAIARRRQNNPQRIYKNHDEWRRAWQDARSDELFSTGNAAVTSGNDLLKLIATDEPGVFDLRIMLPRPCHAKHGKEITIPGVLFSYGAEIIADALTIRERWGRGAKQQPVRKTARGSIAVRIKREGDAWYVTAQISRINDAVSEAGGIVAVDFNDGFLAVANLSADGNCARRDLSRVEINSYGGTTEQRRDAMAKAALAVVRIAIESSRPIAIEKLDFKRKKAELREQGSARRARMLSGMAFAQFRQMIITGAARNGLRVLEINPAFTSFMGRVRYAQQLGTDVHHAAAVCIGRRAMKFSERSSPYAGRTLLLPGNHGHVAVAAPDWMPHRHVWSWWGKCYAIWKRAHEAQLEMLRKKQRTTLEKSTIAASLASEEQFLDGLISGSVATATA